MTGSYLMKRYIAAVEATRATSRATGTGADTRPRGRSGGKPVSSRHIARLTEIRTRLEASRGDDTLEAALRELAALILQSPVTAEAPRLPRAGDDVALYMIHGSRAGQRRAR